MYEQFRKLMNMFKESGCFEPLQETLQLYDKISNNKIQETERLIEGKGISDIFQKYINKIPIEYILEEAHFMGYELKCTPSTLIPTPETENLVREAISYLENVREPKVIEIGTGCGNIAVSLGSNIANARMIATDISNDAIRIADYNIKKYNLEERVDLFCGDLFQPLKDMKLEKQIDLIICNPPYIPSSSVNDLPREIIENEPRIALDAGHFGMDIIMKLINLSASFLKENGKLMFEIGKGQEKFVRRLVEKDGNYEDIGQIYYGNDVRGIIASRVGSN